VAITVDEVRRIARLARLEFTEDEQARFTRQLNAILEHVAHLNRLDTDAIEPTLHAGQGSRALRDDALRDSIPQDEALRNAPEAGRGLFKVPKVIG
jgi:aspartyl-tRNA(Asn)/glutamyl-tRNA(Gln) amidotransferase subunit C